MGCPVATGLHSAPIPGEALTPQNYAEALPSIIGETPTARYISQESGKWARNDVKSLNKQPDRPVRVSCAADSWVGLVLNTEGAVST